MHWYNNLNYETLEVYSYSRTSNSNFSDINECALMTNPCQMICNNTEGGYSCSCGPGFTLNRDNSTCRDIDECIAGSHVCQQRCINTNGSYECGCNPGYKKVGDHCLGKFFGVQFD